MSIHDFLETAQKVRIAVVGDYIEDRYIKGSVERISPEAPVPVIVVKERTQQHGGAGNVAMNIASLGAQVHLFCNHSSPVDLLLALEGTGVTAYINSQVHSIKTRVMSNDHHIVRIDDEYSGNEVIEQPFLNMSWALELRDMLANRTIDVVVLSDYHKGVISKNVAEYIIELCVDVDIPVIVDAKKDFAKFWNATIIKCNNKEAPEDIDAMHIETGVDYIVVTHGANGIKAYSDKPECHINGFSIPNPDVCGAGDIVTSVLAISQRASNYTIEDACTAANHAAAISCKHPGVYIIKKEDVKSFWSPLP